MQQANAKLQELISPVVNGLGYEYVGLECVQEGKGPFVVRIYIDNKDGVSIEDCRKVSRQAGSVLEVEEALKNSYSLEVSSPGIDRRLFTFQQCVEHVGKEIKLRLLVEKDGELNFKGMLKFAKNNQLVVEVAGQELAFNFGDIEQINMVAKW